MLRRKRGARSQRVNRYKSKLRLLSKPDFLMKVYGRAYLARNGVYLPLKRNEQIDHIIPVQFWGNHLDEVPAEVGAHPINLRTIHFQGNLGKGTGFDPRLTVPTFEKLAAEFPEHAEFLMAKAEYFKTRLQ